MGGYAPAAIKWLADEWVRAIPSAVFSGIVSTRTPAYGYHHARNQLPATDYSVQLPEDKQGDPGASCALDISMNRADMALVTGRLIKSADDPHDPRLNGVRFFYGTVDGQNVVGRDCYFGRFATSDSSHLTHEHIDFTRVNYNNYDLMKNVLSVVTGQGVVDLLPDERKWLGDLITNANVPNNGVSASFRDIQGRLGGLQVAAAADEARDKATLVAVQALAAAVNAGGGDVNVAAIKAKIDEVAAAEGERARALHDQLVKMAEENDELRRRLSEALDPA